MSQAQPDKPFMQKLSDRLAGYFNTGDIPALAALYTDDATLLPPGAPPMSGQDAIAAFWAAASKGFGNARLTTLDVQAIGDSVAVEVGALRMQTKTQPPQQVTGKYLVVWVLIDGQWKLRTDIWNSDL